MNKKFFTLIELIVAIVVIGILAAIVMLNLSGWQVESKRTALISNERNVQTAVDHYHLDNGSYPSEIQPELGSPQLVDFEEIDIDYLRKEPEDGYYWIDEHGNVIVTIGIPPKNVNPTEEQIDWIESVGTETSKVYKINPESGYVVNEPNIPFTDGLPLYKKEEGYNPADNYFISAVDELGLETPKIGKGSKTVYPLDKDVAEDNEKAYEVFKLLGGSGKEEFKDAVEVSDGYVMLVSSNSTNGLFEGFTNKSGYVNWYLVKVDYNGNKVWVNKVDTTTHKVLHTLTKSSVDDSVLVGGMVKQYSFLSAGDFYVHKVSEEGNFEWSRIYGGYDEVKILDIHSLSNGDFGIVFEHLPNSNADAIKYTTVNGTHGDPTPNVTLINSSSPSYIGGTRIGDVEIFSDGIIVTGTTKTLVPSILKFNFNGDLLFAKTFVNNANGDEPLSVKKTSDGGYIVAGLENNAVDYHYFIIKTDALGNEQWRKVIAGSGETNMGMYETFYSVTEDANGNFVAVGSSNSRSFTYESNEDGWSHAGILKFDKNGNTIGTYHYGGTTQNEELQFANTNMNNQVTLIGYSGSHDGDMEGIKFSNSTDDDILFITLKK